MATNAIQSGIAHQRREAAILRVRRLSTSSTSVAAPRQAGSAALNQTTASDRSSVTRIHASESFTQEIESSETLSSVVSSAASPSSCSSVSTVVLLPGNWRKIFRILSTSSTKTRTGGSFLL